MAAFKYERQKKKKNYEMKLEYNNNKDEISHLLLYVIKISDVLILIQYVIRTIISIFSMYFSSYSIFFFFIEFMIHEFFTITLKTSKR